jgi:hypothetical protein
MNEKKEFRRRMWKRMKRRRTTARNWKKPEMGYTTFDVQPNPPSDRSASNIPRFCTHHKL